MNSAHRSCVARRPTYATGSRTFVAALPSRPVCAGRSIWVAARSGAYRMSLADGNHFVNATGVEFVRAVACEWSVPFDRRAPFILAPGPAPRYEPAG